MKLTQDFVKRDVVRTRNGSAVLVDTRYLTPLIGFETMVFKYDLVSNSVTDWANELDCKRCESAAEAERIHKEMITKWVS